MSSYKSSLNKQKELRGLVNAIGDELFPNPDERLIFTYKHIKEKFHSSLNGENFEDLHGGKHEGTNDMVGKRAMFVGCLNRPDAFTILFAHELGIEYESIEKKKFKQINYKGFGFPYFTFKDINLRNFHFWLTESYLVQSSERTRP
ncbi:MAG: hypothetical protein GY858_06935, partial [Candidatus Omnitrophica bacterium]|nr:hypothetical protein [Candidatus Omnitrophota bacterium]